MLKRQIELMLLLMENKPVTLDDCCLYLQISKPTLKADIISLNTLLQEYHVQIIYLEQFISFSDLESARHLILLLDSLQKLTIFDKVNLLLILEKQPISLQKLADRLYISRSKAILVVNKINKDNIKSSHLGYEFHGDICLKRNAFINILLPYFKSLHFVDKFNFFCKQHFNLYQYVTENEVIQAKLVAESIKNKVTQYKEEVFTRLFLSLIHYQITHKDNSFTELYTLFSKQYFNQIALDEQSDENKRLIDDLLIHIDDLLSTSFQEDDKLKKNLLQHIDFSWQEYEKSEVVSMDLWTIKTQFPLSYEAAVISNQYLQNIKNISFKGDELIYLSLHYQNSLENQKSKESKIKALILTPYGLAAGQLIQTQLSHTLNQVQIIAILSQSELLNQLHLIEEVDLVFSLSQIELALTKPVIVLPLALEDENIKEINQFIYAQKSDAKLAKIIENATIIHNKFFQDVPNILTYLNQVLESKSCVTSNYLPSLIDREAISSTSIKGIAVPHGKNSYVKKNHLIILNLPEPILWGNEQVDWIFLLAITEHSMFEFPQLFNHFYRNTAKRNFYLNLQKLSKHSISPLQIRQLFSLSNYLGEL
ncbi:PTS sugar transporter subunit IIA [Orbus sturtevantii]|uniref:BglG family transcription antiterminator n=1 Tax=Orbus sturtevantii TaxID=3074109 RepID=UPI00370DDB58